MNYKKPAFWVVLISVVASAAVAVCFLTNPATSVDERLAVFIDCEIASHNQTERSADNFCCLDWQVIGKEKQGDKTTVYMWVLYEEYSNNDGLNVETASHLLTAVTAEKDGENYKLIEYWTPEDGSFYKDSVMDKVPIHLWGKALDSQRYIKEQKAATRRMAEKHFEISDSTEEASVTEKQALIPMVMVDGVLYLDTGFKSTLEKRNDVIDGEITSRVDSHERPSADNQSNFGSGYPYQTGTTAGTVELLIDNEWWIFATEDIRRELQSPAMIKIFDSGLTASISSGEEIRLITKILSSADWTEGTTDCLPDYEITIGGHSYLYHLSCGTINDAENNRNWSLDGIQKTELNKVIEEIYYSMTERVLEWNYPISLPFLEAGKYIMPLDMSDENVQISRGFSGQYPAHDGLDIAAPEGTEIFASADGTVVKSTESPVGDGNHVVIKHSNGYYTLYAHCSELIATEGAEVKQGDVIAKIGSTGNSTGPHLHFELIFGYESEQGGLSIDVYNAIAFE